jgi:hypothetical protein
MDEAASGQTAGAAESLTILRIRRSERHIGTWVSPCPVRIPIGLTIRATE